MQIENPLTAFNFDNMVGIFGMNVDNYLSETKTVGSKNNRKTVPKHTQKQAIRKAISDMKRGGKKRSNRFEVDLALMAQGVDVIDS